MQLYKYIIIYYVMLNYQELIINKPQARNSIWSKDSNNAYLLTTIH